MYTHDLLYTYEYTGEWSGDLSSASKYKCQFHLLVMYMVMVSTKVILSFTLCMVGDVKKGT